MVDSYIADCNYEAFKNGSCPRKTSNGIFNMLAVDAANSIEGLTKVYSQLEEMLSNQPEQEAAIKLLKKAIEKQSNFEIAYRKMANMLMKEVENDRPTV